MKVLCIDNKAEINKDCIGSFIVKEGDIYNVSGEFDKNGEHWYQFKEDMAGNGWNDVYFIPLSDFNKNLMVCLNTKPKHKNKLYLGLTDRYCKTL